MYSQQGYGQQQQTAMLPAMHQQQQMAASNNQQCYQQEGNYGQQAYGQQCGAQYNQDGYQPSYGHQASGQYGLQCQQGQQGSGQYGQQCQQQPCDQYYNTQPDQAWQYGMQGGDASWNGNAVQAKDNG